MTSDVFERINAETQNLRKNELIRRILDFEGPPLLDYTEGHLKKQTEDRLRHILVAALTAAAKRK